MTANMIGAYGDWTAQAAPDSARLSFRQPMFGNVEGVARNRERIVSLLVKSFLSDREWILLPLVIYAVGAHR